MSTTIRKVAIALPVVAVAWVALMAVVMRYSDAAPAAVVPFPTLQGFTELPENAGLLSANAQAITLANRPGLTEDLYAAGAWLVLPAGLTGCLPLSESHRILLERYGSQVVTQ